MNPEKSKMEKGNLVKAFHSQFDQEIPPIRKTNYMWDRLFTQHFHTWEEIYLHIQNF